MFRGTLGAGHFLKIVDEETLQNSKLPIPDIFTRKHGEALFDWVLVKPPCGSKWKMELAKEDNHIWLEKGWSNFAKHYAIKSGFVINFKYEGNSEFNVAIYDLSLFEIDYPSVPISLVGSNIGDDSVEKSSMPSSRPQKKMRTMPTANFQSNPPGQNLESETEGENNSRFQKLPATTRKERYEIFKRMKIMSEYEEAKALKLISDFKTTRPFFKNLPVEFATGNDYQPCDDTIPLQVSYGDGMNSSPWHAGYKTWDVEYKFEVYNGVPTPTFQAGWPAFVQDNNLKVGDVCVFVLLREMYIAFNVLIFRVGTNFFKSLGKQTSVIGRPWVGGRTFLVRNRGEFSEDSSCPNQQVFIEKSRLIERALFKSKNHFFPVVIEPSLLGSGRSLTIPLYFAKDYLKNEGIVILLTDRRYCSVQFEIKNKNNSKMRAVFSGGWKDFTKDNYLQVNDVCIFEFLKGSANVFKVTIHRADEYASD